VLASSSVQKIGSTQSRGGALKASGPHWSRNCFAQFHVCDAILQGGSLTTGRRHASSAIVAPLAKAPCGKAKTVLKERTGFDQSHGPHL